MSNLLFLVMALCADSETIVYGDTQIFEPPAPGELAVADNGDVFLIHFDERKILHYAPDGRKLPSFGGKGEGPGEFSFPQALYIDGNRLYVTDPGRDRIQVFDLDGKFVTSLRVPESDTVVRVAGGFVTADLLELDANAGKPIEVAFVDDAFQNRTPLVTLPRGPSQGLRIEIEGGGRPTVKFNPVSDGPLLTVSGDGRTVFARPAGGFHVHVIDVATKKVVRVIERDEQGLPFNEAYGRERLEDLQEKMKSQHSPVTLKADFPERFPPVRDLRGMDDLLAVRRWTGTPGKKEAFLWLDAAGGEVQAPCPPDDVVRVLALKGDYAYVAAHAEDTDGYVVRVPRARIHDAVTAHPSEGERAPRFLLRTN